MLDDKLASVKQRLIEHYRLSLEASEECLTAFARVPREHFVLPRDFGQAYSDHPLPILANQTISAPHMCVLILGYLHLEPGLQVLEIGSGSGYQAALIAEMVGNSGHVYTIERITELAEFARFNIKKTNYEKIITVLEGDGTLGYPEHAPYDRIIITAAGPIIPPPLKEQLKVGGILSMPLGAPGWSQTMINVYKKSEIEFSQEDLTSVAFVPLRGKYGTG